MHCTCRYKESIGVSADVETAARYSVTPTKVTADLFNIQGAQAVVESDRINDHTAPEVNSLLNAVYWMYFEVFTCGETSSYIGF